MQLQKPSHDASEQEEESRVQSLSSVAPPQARDGRPATAHDIPTFVPARSQSQPLRMLGWVMVIGGAVALALVLVIPKLRSAPAPQRAASPAPLAVPAAPEQVPEAQETPPATSEPAHGMKKERRTKRAASVSPAAESNVTSIRIRIRARVAPVRATPESDGKVFCSLKRGAVMRSLQQTQSTSARWFAVQCDKDSPGWVHEKFVSLR